jgi:hypothetical protein
MIWHSVLSVHWIIAEYKIVFWIFLQQCSVQRTGCGTLLSTVDCQNGVVLVKVLVCVSVVVGGVVVGGVVVVV